MTPPQHERLEARVLHVGKVFRLLHKVFRLASGLRQEVDVIDHPGAVAILARDERGRILLVRQFRPAFERELCEVPAGRLEAGEDPLVAARRELEEETGLRARQWRALKRILPAPGFCNEVIHVFEARGLEAVGDGALACDADEEIEVVWEDPRIVISWDPIDAKTLICLGLARAEATD